MQPFKHRIIGTSVSNKGTGTGGMLVFFSGVSF